MDEKRTRSLILTSYFGLLAIGIAMTTIGPSLPYLMKELDFTLNAAGVLISFRAVGRMIATVIGGAVSDRLGRGPVLVTGGIFMAAGLAASVIYPTWLSLVFWSLVLGLGIGQVDGALNALVADLSSGKRGFGLNMLHVFFGVGSLLGPLGAGYILERWHDWRAVMLFSAVICLGFAAVIAIQHVPRSAVPKRQAGSEPQVPQIPLWKDPLIILLILVMFLYSGTSFGLTGWINTYLSSALLFTNMLSSMVLSLFNVGLTAGRIVCSFISDRIGFSRLLAICSIGSFIALGIAVLTQSGLVTTIGFCLTGFFYSGLFPTSVAYASSRYPERSGTASGLLITCASFGSVVVPSLMGAVADGAGLAWAMKFSWFLLAVLAVVGWIILGYGKPAKVRPGKAATS